MIFCIALPFYVIYIINKHFSEIKAGNEELNDKIGAWWEGMRFDETQDKGIIVYAFWFLARRFALGILCVVWRDILFFQVDGLVFFTIAAMILVGVVKPMETPKENNLEYFNEMMIMSVMYCMMTFTDWGPEIEI